MPDGMPVANVRFSRSPRCVGLPYLIILTLGFCITLSIFRHFVDETPPLAYWPVAVNMGILLCTSLNGILPKPCIPEHQPHDHYLDDDNGLSLPGLEESPVGDERV